MFFSNFFLSLLIIFSKLLIIIDILTQKLKIIKLKFSLQKIQQKKKSSLIKMILYKKIFHLFYINIIMILIVL